MHGGHFLFSHHLQTPKMSRAFLVCLWKQGTGHPHGLLDVLVGQGFLSAFVDFLLDHLLRFAFDTACQPRFQPLKRVTGGFQRISGPFKPLETPVCHLQNQPFAILVVFVWSKSRQTASEHADRSLHSVHRFVFWEEVGSLSLFILPLGSPFQGST